MVLMAKNCWEPTLKLMIYTFDFYESEVSSIVSLA